MKKGFSLLVMISFIVIAVSAAANPFSSAPEEYQGDFCWSFVNPVLGTSGTIQIGISHIGGGHYLCSGMSNVTDPEQMEFPAYGNAEVSDGIVYLTLSLAGIRNGVIGNDMIKAQLYLPGLDGTFDAIGVYADAVEISEGTFTHIACE